MELIETPIQGSFVLQPGLIKDDRGYFFESFNERTFAQKTGLNVKFVQDNESFSVYGVIRGLHAQRGESAQAKLVRVIQGEVLDVIVDGRKESPSYGQHFSIRLSGENKKQLFVPRGCYHGFSVLSDTATFFYKCDNFYHKEAECGLYYADKSLAIDWGIPPEKQLLTEKDLKLPLFER